MEWFDLAFLIPIVAMGMPVLIIWIHFHYDKQNKEQFHKTLQKLIESGQELSPDLLESIPGYRNENNERNDVRSGVIAIGTGVGLALFGHFGLGEDVVFGVGLLVLSIGAGRVAYGIYSKNKN
jgi:hypothetical protein